MRISGVFIMFEKLPKNKKPLELSKVNEVGDTSAYFTDAEWDHIAAIYSVIEPIARVALTSQKNSTGSVAVGIFTAEHLRHKYWFCKPTVSVDTPEDGSNKKQKTEQSTFQMINWNAGGVKEGKFPRKKAEYKDLDVQVKTLCDRILDEISRYFPAEEPFNASQLLRFAVHPLFVWIGLRIMAYYGETLARQKQYT
jgi:hypothetical protein